MPNSGTYRFFTGNTPLKEELSQAKEEMSSNNKLRTQHKISKFSKMSSIFYLFGEAISQINFAINVTNLFQQI